MGYHMGDEEILAQRVEGKRVNGGNHSFASTLFLYMFLFICYLYINGMAFKMQTKTHNKQPPAYFGIISPT